MEGLDGMERAGQGRKRRREVCRKREVKVKGQRETVVMVAVVMVAVVMVAVVMVAVVMVAVVMVAVVMVAVVMVAVVITSEPKGGGRAIAVDPSAAHGVRLTLVEPGTV